MLLARHVVRCRGRQAAGLAALVGALACTSDHGAGRFAIEAVYPRCPRGGDTVSITLSGGEAGECAAARIFAGGREIENLGQTNASPLIIAARLPADFNPPLGSDLRVACSENAAPAQWRLSACSSFDAGDAARLHSSDAAALCALPLRVAVTAVDERGRAFERDQAGLFLVPAAAADFTISAEGSQAVSPVNVSYTFSSECFPRVTVAAPVLGGLDATTLGPDRTCAFMVEITDEDCPGPVRTGSGAGGFKVVR